MIDFQDVSKFFGGEPLLENVTFRINRNERIGMVGPNGAGKSTIFGIILGETPIDKGTIGLPKDLRIGCMRQQLPTFGPEVTLLDFTADAIPELRTMTAELKSVEHRLAENNLSEKEKNDLLKRHGVLQTGIEQLGAYTLRNEAESALCNLGFPVEKMQSPLKSFSGGWQMRAMLARVLISNPDILLLDEPSNYLDIPAVEWLCRFLKSYRGTLLLISHDRFLLRKLTQVTLEVNSGKVTRYPGDYDFYRRSRDERFAAMSAAKRNLDRKKEHLERGIERFRAKSTKAAQAKSWRKALDRLDDIELPDDLSYSGAIRFPEPPAAGIEAARIENVQFGYDPAKPVLKNVNLEIACGDKIAFVGYNGMGKTTLLKLLVGKLKPQAGRIVIGHNIIMGYQAQEFADILVPEKTVYEAVREALPPNAPTSNLMNVLGSFGFPGDDAEKTCGVLSGGEKIRLCFARIFVNPPNFLILDEPTTHLDIAARELLQKALIDYRGTLCLVSHDIEFIRAVATTIVAMENHTTRKYFGNYDYFLEKSAELNADKNPLAAKTLAANSSDSKERRRERARLRAELSERKKVAEKAVKSTESELEKVQKRANELMAQLADYNANIDFQQANKELFATQQKINDLTAKWETSALALEEILAQNAKIHED